MEGGKAARGKTGPEVEGLKAMAMKLRTERKVSSYATRN